MDSPVDGSLVEALEPFLLDPYVSPLFASDLTGNKRFSPSVSSCHSVYRLELIELTFANIVFISNRHHIELMYLKN